MPLSWNEIKSRATAFTKEWENEVSEDSEAKSFWDDFFNVFGIGRRRVATFELQVKKLNQKVGFIDLLWKGVLLVEHKSRGKNLDKAYQQAKDYFPGLTEKELPRYILVSDFERFRLYDLEENKQHDFLLSDFINSVHLFGFIAGYQKRTYKEQDPVNIEAAELMGKLHDKLKSIGYEGHSLELYLVRLVFLLFADDTNIFEKGIFYDYLDLTTEVDGSDLAATLAQLFEVLNTPEEKRLRNINESLDAFPYVNGKLFEERLPIAAFDNQMRKTLMDCCLLDWGKISPAIFGSLFQSVMDVKARRNLGAHYTSEKNILKLIKPLFLDELEAEYKTVKDSKAKLQKFHDKLSSLRFLDPACGCGNFLIIAYREIRLLEIEIIKQRLKLEGYREEVLREAKMDVGYLVQCDVDKFYGIEYEEFPAQIAQVAMWLADHQMNQLVSNTFGEYYVRLPLRKSATILHGNAIRTDWQSLIEPLSFEKGDPKYDYILGNPPFIGKTLINPSQREDMAFTFNDLKGAGDLDYVSAWYIKASQYMSRYSGLNERGDSHFGHSFNRSAHTSIKKMPTKTAFVSTNSITQGEQVLILWQHLVKTYEVEIFFAHRTFKWNNEARGNANVHVVIIGFSNFKVERKVLFEYEHVQKDPTIYNCKHINGYLLPQKEMFISKRQKPICSVPEIRCGNKPSDGGNLLLTDSEKDELILSDPDSARFIRKYIGSDEFINNKSRWCLWLKDAGPEVIRKSQGIMTRVNLVREFRAASSALPTRQAADYPARFFYISQPKTDYIVIPEVSSERRKYVPIGLMSKEVISSNKIFLLASASLYHYGILQSLMHMAWIRVVGGRMKSDYSYSGTIVYNTFSWPVNPNKKNTQAVEAAAQNVLYARREFPNASLADLYDPNTMPLVLAKAHQALDKAVDLSYRTQPFVDETRRIEYLFELYEKYTSQMLL